MAEKVLMKGNEALAESALRAGCRFFFGYPITPQTELAAYMSKRMPKIGRDLPSGRKRDRRHQHGLRRLGCRRARHDVLVVSRHLAQGRGHLLHGGCRPAGRHHQRSARRPRPRRHPAFPVGLLAGDARNRPRRLPRRRLRTLDRAGDERPRVRRVRRRRQVPYARHDSRPTACSAR